MLYRRGTRQCGGIRSGWLIRNGEDDQDEGGADPAWMGADDDAPSVPPGA